MLNQRQQTGYFLSWSAVFRFTPLIKGKENNGVYTWETKSAMVT